MRRHHGQTLRERLAAGTPTLGTWVKIASVENVELLGLAGFDYIVVDLEHAPLDLETAFQQIGFAHAHDMDALVRVPELNPAVIQRVLDAGADGILVPHVDDVDQARRSVDATRFPPLGHRGFGNTSRAGLWGSLDRAEYLRHGNEDVLLIVQLECAEAVEAAAEIGAIDGVDALFLGPADLSVSEGLLPGHDRVKALIAESVDGARRAGIPIGTAVGGDATLVAEAVADGFGFVMVSNDASMLLDGARRVVSTFREVTTA